MGGRTVVMGGLTVTGVDEVGVCGVELQERTKINMRMIPTRIKRAIRTRSFRIGFWLVTAHQLEELLVILRRLHLAPDKLQGGLRII